MPLSPDVAWMIEQLMRANLAWLAAEIIEAIELPQPVHVTSGDAVDHARLPSAGDDVPGARVEPARAPPADLAEDVERKLDLDDRDQMAVAADILRLRLVDPVRRLREAERIAGRLVAVGRLGEDVRDGIPNASAKPVPIGLDGREGAVPVGAADVEYADRLDKLLLEVAGRQPRSALQGEGG